MKLSQFPDFLSDNSKNSTLGDGVSECAFGSIPSLLRSLDSFFSDRSLTPDITLALQSYNSLTGALVLLWLIHRKYRFFLVPPTQDNEFAWENIPDFCSFLIKVEESVQTPFSQESPPWDRLLSAQASPTGPTGENKTRQHPQGMLYVRTSGSMGKSKIVCYTLENLLGNANNCLRHYGFNHQDRMMIPIPIFHLYGLGAAFLPALMGGASVELQNNSHLIKYLARERKFRPNIAFVTPLLCDMLNKGKRDNTAYRLIVTSGQKIQKNLFESFDSKFGGCLVDQYGCSEMGAISASLPNDPIQLKSRTMGRPMPGLEIRLDPPPEAMEEGASPGKQGGLLFVRHPHGFSGYVDEEGDFIVIHEANQWYQTGDWGVADQDGHIRVVDRADNRVNRSGYLVSLSEIETRIGELPQISEVLVLALDEETQRGRTLVAVCVLDIESSEDNIQALCRDILPSHAVPDRILMVPFFPYLSGGKIDRQSLKVFAEQNPGK